MENHREFSEMSLFETIETCRTLARYLQVLATDVPKCRLIHSSIADVTGFLAIIAKLRDRIPYILTEHGVYYRERLLDLAGRTSKGQTAFWANFEKAIAKLNYHYADFIAPVSRFNAQWESELGADRKKIEVIYNGVDTERFRPMPTERISNAPTVSAVTRIDPLKGILDLITAMRTILDSVPNAKCLVFGSPSDSDYARYCLEARDRLGLSDSVFFMGFTTETPRAFNSCDVVTLPSISEGFPFSLIEGMACEKATVATDVGGVGEALSDTGILVPPRNPTLLGEAIARLLTDDQHSKKLGFAARNRILTEYTVSRFTDRYKEIYVEMS
jgi:glycosyltransferase involved in cell wall biosynthesis